MRCPQYPCTKCSQLAAPVRSLARPWTHALGCALHVCVCVRMCVCARVKRTLGSMFADTTQYHYTRSSKQQGSSSPCEVTKVVRMRALHAACQVGSAEPLALSLALVLGQDIVARLVCMAAGQAGRHRMHRSRVPDFHPRLVRELTCAPRFVLSTASSTMATHNGCAWRTINALGVAGERGERARGNGGSSQLERTTALVARAERTSCKGPSVQDGGRAPGHIRVTGSPAAVRPLQSLLAVQAVLGGQAVAPCLSPTSKPTSGLHHRQRGIKHLLTDRQLASRIQ
jgi:hypothetical protein